MGYRSYIKLYLHRVCATKYAIIVMFTIPLGYTLYVARWLIELWFGVVIVWRLAVATELKTLRDLG
jgi:hypothetical protein